MEKLSCFLKSIVGILILSFPTLLLGQAEMLRFNRLTVADSLASQNYNNSIYRDSVGFVWIGSINGLNRFDGKEVKQYMPDPDDLDALADGSIQSGFYEDKNQNVWFSTVEAVHCYDRQSGVFRRFQFERRGKKSLFDLQLLFLDQVSDNLWVFMDDSLFLCPINNPTQKVFLDTISNFYDYNFHLTYVPERTQYNLVVPKSNGWQIRRYQNGCRLENKDHPQKQLPGFLPSHFYFENKDRLWVAADTGLIAFDMQDESIKIYGDFNENPLRGVNGISLVDQNRLLVSTKENGLYYFDYKNDFEFTHRIFSIEEDLVKPYNYNIDNIYLDPDDNLWISSPGRGVYFVNLKKRKFNSFLFGHRGPQDGMSHIISMARDSRGWIWCLTAFGIVVLDKDGNLVPGFEQFQGEHSIFTRNNPIHIFADNNDRIWVSMQEGLYVLADIEGDLERIMLPDMLASKQVAFTYVFQSPSTGRIFVSTFNAGIYEAFEKKGELMLKPLPELSDTKKRYTTIFEDGEGYVYFNQTWSSILVYKWDDNSLVYDTTLAKGNTWVSAFSFDKNSSTTWVATTQGLFKLNNIGSNIYFQKDTIFPYQTLNGMLQDTVGNLWISTNRGLVRYNPDSSYWKTYAVADGIQSLEFNFTSALLLEDGRMAFGGVNGVNIFNPSDIENLDTKARPTITNILINHEDPQPGICAVSGVKDISLCKSIILPYKKNTVTIQFASLEYSDPKGTQFKYYLENEGAGEYGPPTTQNGVTFFDLREGTYIFKLIASNSDGVWSSKFSPATLEIVILPPWQRSSWFKSLVALTLLALLYAYYRFRIAQIRKKEEFKRKEAELKQQMAETETAILRLQMNPHFIFNSMNSINSYILKKDIGTASDYLGRFSRLMRMILDLAANQFVTVFEEKELLELYMQTEAMRFEEKFSYQIEMADGLDPDNTILPTMILQPFVENAIWHGLSGKGGKGQVNVRFEQLNGSLVCSVEDNGIGREAAAKVKAGDNKHVSKALAITARRLELLEKETGQPAICKIIDLKRPDGKPAGTKVTLILPML